MTPVGSKNAWVIVPVLLLMCLSSCDGAEYCYANTPSWTTQSQVRLSAFISLRDSKDNICGEILPEALQNYVAVAWIIDKLNQGFIPGIKFDFQLYDDCQSPVYAARNALELLSPSLSSTVINCTTTDSSIHLGILGPSRSTTATEVARLLKNSNIPMVSSSATVPDLSNKNDYPNFFRTALSDTVQIKPVLEILKRLDWTYVVVVHSDDIYGQTAADMLKIQGRNSGICFVKSLKVSLSTDRSQLFADLLAVKEKTEDGTLGVIYFGMWGVAENLLDYYDRNSKENGGLYWLMSESIGKVYDVFRNKGNIVRGTITLSPAAVEFNELKTFWSNQLGSNALVQEYLKQLGSDRNLLNASQSDYVASTVDAVYAYAVGLKDAHTKRCNGNPGVCTDLANHLNNGGILQDIKSVMVNYTSLDKQFVPSEYVQQHRHFSFKVTGDIHRGSDSVMYEINSFSGHGTNKFAVVGSYSTNGLILNKTAIQMPKNNIILSGDNLPKSICKGFCEECVNFGKVPMVYLEGDVYLVGVFSIHQSDAKDPFKCSQFRSVSSDTVALEAFIYAVKEMRKLTGIKFGAIAFDDCYSSVRLTSIVSEYFSAVGNPLNVFQRLIPINQTVGVIGSLSSGSTIPLARFFSSLNIPTISYASSSPDLDDRVNFPNFLRTVPSDVEQAKAMVALIKEMGWEYVSLVFVNNNYGTKGMKTFQMLAQEAGICVTEPKNVSEISYDDVDSDMYMVLNDLLKEDAKVVVFFGIDTRYEKFVEVVNKQGKFGKFIIIASEDWGNKQSILNAGERATWGALTLKIEPITATPFTGFQQYLVGKTPDNYVTNPWFEEFWQHQFKCNIRGGFNNIFKTQCQPQLRLTQDNMKNHLQNQRVSHVQYAVYAAGEGVKTAKSLLCSNSGEKFPCSFFYSPQYTHKVWESIREVKNPRLASFMFDDDGNGAIGFTIYNVQSVDNKLQYVEVGSFGGRGLQLEKDKLRFYNQLGYKTTIIAKCSTGNQCSACVHPATSSPTLPPVIRSGPDTNFRVADIILIIVVLLLIILLIIALILGCRYLRRQVTGLSKEIQKKNVDNEHIYQAVSERRVYQNEQPPIVPRTTSPATPNHIYFVNGSNDTLNEEGGQINQAFRPDDTMSQMNASGGTFNSAGVATTSSNSGQLQALSDNASTSHQNTPSPSHSSQIVMTGPPQRALPVVGQFEGQRNGRIPNGIITSPVMQRPSTLQFHQNPRMTDLGHVTTENGHIVNRAPQTVRPDLQHMPVSYVGSPLSSVSPSSDTRHLPSTVTSPNSPPSQTPLASHASPVLTTDLSVLQMHANRQAILDQQAAYAALELQRINLIQQQTALNQPTANHYIHLSSAESRPSEQNMHVLQQTSPEEIPFDRPRPRTNPNHVPSSLNRFIAHHGSIDSLRSSGESNRPPLLAQGSVSSSGGSNRPPLLAQGSDSLSGGSNRPPLLTQSSMENISEAIPMQSLNHDSRISRV